MDELPGTTREDKRATGMFKSAFNNAFRAGLHALAYQHVTALNTPLPKTPATRKSLDVS